MNHPLARRLAHRLVQEVCHSVSVLRAMFATFDSLGSSLGVLPTNEHEVAVATSLQRVLQRFGHLRGGDTNQFSEKAEMDDGHPLDDAFR